MITITNKEFNQLSAYIKTNYGIYLKPEKQTLVTGRLQNVLLEKGFKNFTEYYDYLMADKTGEAVTAMLDKITTNHTYFMREEDHFLYLKNQVLPEITAAAREKDLRIWCAGCSSGEEAYTLAMILDEFFGKNKTAWDTKVLATDISSKVLGMATQGVYSKKSVETLPKQWRMDYFKNYDNGNAAIVDKIKNEIIFRKFNLMEAKFPFKRKFHVIFCRNVMIYFDLKTKMELVNKFYDSMEDGGYLFIGHSESLNREETNYNYVLPAIYKKI